MAVDRPGAETAVDQVRTVGQALPPDRPGGDGVPSRADSRRAAAVANSEEPCPLSDGSAVEEDVDQRRAIFGEGLPDDNARVADLDDAAVERSLLDRARQAFAGRIRGDQPVELSGIVDRPDFQDPFGPSGVAPDRYGTPLDRPDGTRTPLFNGIPAREQTEQGDLGDCGIIAALGAVAGHRPEAIRDCVRETGDGNYEVRLHEAKFSTKNMRYEPTGHSITLTVTPDLPVHDDAPGEPAFAGSNSARAAWAPVLEKAIAGVDQTWDGERRRKWSDGWDVQGRGGDPPVGYVRLNQGSNASERAELLTQLTGEPARTWEFPIDYDHRGRSPDHQLLDEIRERLAECRPVLIGTRARKEGEPSLPKRLADCHAYEVTRVDEHGRLHLRNSWNFNHPEPLTIKEFRANVRPCYTTLEHK